MIVMNMSMMMGYGGDHYSDDEYDDDKNNCSLPTYYQPIYLPTYHLLTYLRVGVSVDMSMSTLHLLYEVVGIGQIPIVCNRYAEGEVSVERLSFAGPTAACCGVAYMTQSDIT